MLKIIDLGDGRIYSGRDAHVWPDGLYINVHHEKPREGNRFVIYKYKNFLYGIRESGTPHIEVWMNTNLSNNYRKVQGILL